LRSPIVTLFDETLEKCLNATLDAVMGPQVRGQVYSILQLKGISKSQVSPRINDVLGILRDAFGEGHRIIIHRMVVELYQAYYQRVDFKIADSVPNLVAFLKERVVVDHLRPRGAQEDALDSFFDQKKGSVHEY
jgi:hypothetical protein